MRKYCAYHEDRQQRGSGDMSGETIVGTAYLWDSDTIAEEAPLKASGEVDWDKVTNKHYEPNTFRPIAKETANGELFYIVNDHLRPTHAKCLAIDTQACLGCAIPQILAPWGCNP